MGEEAGARASDWQRRYDKSLTSARRSHSADEVSAGEFAAIETSGCIPGWAGLIALAVTGIVLLIRRRLHRT